VHAAGAPFVKPFGSCVLDHIFDTQPASGPRSWPIGEVLEDDEGQRVVVVIHR
jgi:hypothetical protein